MVLARMGVVGQGAAVPCPASAHSHPGARTALLLKLRVIAMADFVVSPSLAYVW